MMKVKLQPPSATDLPAHNPILPPTAITQVMLVANPLKASTQYESDAKSSSHLNSFKLVSFEGKFVNVDVLVH